MSGLGGNDVLRIGDGGHADGGTGTDQVIVDLGKSALGVSFTFSRGSVAVNANTSFTAMESFRFIGSQGNDHVIGSDGADALADGTGNDQLFGGAGNDVFTRGAVDTSRTPQEISAQSFAYPDAGIDSIDGGSGYDTLNFASRHALVDLYSEVDLVRASVGVDLQSQSLNSGLAQGLTITGIERVDGGYENDELRGSNGTNELHGNEANDIVDGRGGNDKIDGGVGADDLWGGAGRDLFLYNADSFFIDNRYLFGELEDASGDRIHDFTRGQDKLVFEGDAPTGKVVSVGHGSDGSGIDSQFYFDVDSHTLWTRYEGDSRFVEDGEQIKVAVLDNVSTLSASDFIFG